MLPRPSAAAPVSEGRGAVFCPAADAVVLARDLMDGSRSMAEVCRQAVDAVMAYDPENGGSMHRARPRPMDVAAVLNRHPQMLCIQKR